MKSNKRKSNKQTAESPLNAKKTSNGDFRSLVVVTPRVDAKVLSQPQGLYLESRQEENMDRKCSSGIIGL